MSSSSARSKVCNSRCARAGYASARCGCTGDRNGSPHMDKTQLNFGENNLNLLSSCAAVVFGSDANPANLSGLIAVLSPMAQITYHGPDVLAEKARALGWNIGAPIDDMEQAVQHVRAQDTDTDVLLVALDTGLRAIEGEHQ